MRTTDVTIDGKSYRLDISGWDFVRQFFPSTDDETADAFLWHCTAFPFVDAADVARQTHEMYKRSGGNIEKAFQLADEDMKEAMENEE